MRDQFCIGGLYQIFWLGCFNHLFNNCFTARQQRMIHQTQHFQPLSTANDKLWLKTFRTPALGHSDSLHIFSNVILCKLPKAHAITPINQAYTPVSFTISSFLHCQSLHMSYWMESISLSTTYTFKPRLISLTHLLPHPKPTTSNFRPASLNVTLSQPI